MAAVPPNANALAEVHQLLTLCGITQQAMRARVIDLEGLSSIHDFAQISDAEIDNMAKRCEARPPAQKVSFGLVHIKKLKAICFWAKKAKRAGVQADVTKLNAQKLVELVDEMNLEKDEKSPSEKLYPDKFDPQKVKSWVMSFENYLDTQLGINGIPMSYVICKDNIDPVRAKNEHERLIWTAPIQGPAYNKDNCEVFHILKDRVLGTEGWAWFQGVTNGDGRGAMKRTTEHYFGTAHTNRSAVEGESKLSKTYYWNESYFPFDKYISKLTEIFQDLEDANEPKTEHQKVNIMLSQVQSSNPEVVALKTTIRHSYPEDFIGARDAMGAQIASIFPGALADNKGGSQVQTCRGVDADISTTLAEANHSWARLMYQTPGTTSARLNGTN